MEPGSVSQWIEQVKAGEESAAARLWDRYHRRLLDVARRKLHGGQGPADEEDVVIDALASFFKRTTGGNFPELQDREGLWKLLVTITNRKAVNQIAHDNRQKRGAGRTITSLEDGGQPAASPQDAPDYAVMVAESLAALLESLETDEFREIALAKLEGCTNEEIAERIGYSIPTVERRLRIIRTQLQEEIDRDDVTESDQ